MSSGWDPSSPTLTSPRPASTVVLLKDSAEGPRVLITVRPRHLRFMGGAWVFPGGSVAAADRDPRWERLSTLTGREAAAALHLPAGEALGFWVAAVREAFEEVGWMPGSGPPIDRAAATDPARFLAAVEGSGQRLATDLLAPAGRWVTPVGAPIRFDARFFVSAVEPGWEAAPDPGEVESCVWLTPGDALAELGSGRALMAPPTVEMLQRIRGVGSAREIVDSLRSSEGVGSGRISTRLSPLVHLVLAPNPGVMTGPGTNTYVAGPGPSVVIDPAVDDPGHLDAVGEAAPDITSIVVTHRHPDHCGGAAELARRTGARVRAFGTEPVDGIAPEPLGDGDLIELPGLRLRALHTPGHAPDHVCLLLEGAASVFAGDLILGEGTSVIAPPEGNMEDYLASLGRLRGLHVDRIYPGHFRALDGGPAVIDALIDHRRAREAKVVDALARGPAGIDRIVSLAYDDTPLELHPIARYSALAHLEMLEARGRVARAADGWTLV